MRSRRIYNSIWTLMVAIALLAFLMGGFIELSRRRERYRRWAAEHTRRIKRDEARAFSGSWREEREMAEDRRRRNAWHQAMANKWQLATYYPWLPVEPDTPAP